MHGDTLFTEDSTTADTAVESTFPGRETRYGIGPRWSREHHRLTVLASDWRCTPHYVE